MGFLRCLENNLQFFGRNRSVKQKMLTRKSDYKPKKSLFTIFFEQKKKNSTPSLVLMLLSLSLEMMLDVFWVTGNCFS